MFTGIIIIASIGLLGILSHRRTRLENRIYKNVPLTGWLNVLVFPVMLYLGWFSVVKNILARPVISYIPFDDFDILAITILFGVYAFTGNAIHFTGKILWRYLEHHKHTMAYHINEMFHGKLSHYLVYLNVIFCGALLSVLEINHPLIDRLPLMYLFVIIVAGIISGLSARRGIFYANEWFGGYNKPLFFVILGLQLILAALFKSLKLHLSFYPISVFIISIFVTVIIAFLARQIFIFARLGNKRRLRFLVKVLSV